MNFLFESRQPVRYAFIAVATVIALVSLVFSNTLVKGLAKEERNKVEIWAAATELLSKSDESSDMNLVLQILQSNKTIPVILYDKTSNTLSANNIKLPEKDTQGFLLKKTGEFAVKHDPIELEELNQSVYFDDSFILKRLQIYPYVQLLVISIFIALAFFALMSSQKAQQNKVWAGLSKETAHQLGTPISSLIAWTEYLKLKGLDPALINEMGKDVYRLEVIAERFSKIGSVSDIKPVTLQDAVKQSV
ncbi:MAG: ATP-binding protein, partial [Petrimonas sp.]|nr:ATP-binding protein [Petrimonas sp.]